MKLAKVIFLLTGLTLFVAAPAEAQVRKTIRFVVPVAAGGSYDLMARIIADKLSQDRDAVIVENMPGAAMLNGMGAVARAAPDGQTIGLMLSPVTVQPALVTRMPFDIMKDIAPATLIGWNYNVLVVIPSLPVTSVKELIAYARAHPGELNFGSGGNATPAHIAGEFFKLLTGTEMNSCAISKPCGGYPGHARRAGSALVWQRVRCSPPDSGRQITRSRGGRTEAAARASRRAEHG